MRSADGYKPYSGAAAERAATRRAPGQVATRAAVEGRRMLELVARRHRTSFSVRINQRLDLIVARVERPEEGAPRTRLTAYP